MSGVTREARYDAVLDPTERIEGRPFTDPERTSADAAVMRSMLQREREIARSWVGNGTHSASIRADGSDGGRRQHLAVPDTDTLVRVSDVTAVGFFGQTRDRDHTVLFELEQEVARGFPEYVAAGLLSYYDLELDDGSYGFGNLILFATSDVPPEWFANSAHERAVSISPRHYHSIRLHKGTIAAPVLGDGDLAIERTKYFDFDSDPPWRGLRVFAAA
jgi:hypothetical protein